MYNVLFESENGIKYYFGKNGSTVFDMDLGSGVPVNIGTSQGFYQIGETIQNKSVPGRTINVTGVIYENVQKKKMEMRKAFAPFSVGRLIFEENYYIRVCVKSTPSFSTVRNDGRFTMQLYAPYPFFSSVNSKNEAIGTIKPLFSFPVNYSEPHKFGEKGEERYKNVYNDSDVKVPFSLYVYTSGSSSNIVISNLQTFQTLRINGSIEIGDVIHIYRNEDNVLRAELTSDGETNDIISWIDETSDLFELEVGDNLISAIDDEGGASLIANISYNPVVVSLYES